MAAREQIRFLRGLGAAALLAALLAATAAAALLPGSASAAVIRVNSKFDNPADDAICMLREAVLAANSDSPALGCAAGSGDDVIVLTGGTYRLTRPPSSAFDPLTGSLDVNDPQGQDLAITGFVGPVTIDASPIADRLILARSPLVLNYVTLIGGDSATSPDLTGYGGAVATFGSPLAVRHSLIGGSEATLGGGGILASGPLEIDQSTISANTVNGATGAGGGGIEAGGAVAISGSTVAGNTVTTPDASGVGGGIRFAGSLSLEGAILADNVSDGTDPECRAAGVGAIPSSAGFNVVEHASAGCGLTLASSDEEADPQLNPLADNGGRTYTYAITPGSPAEDIGPLASSPSCAGRLDQRGVPRGAPESGACDAGAYELSRCSGLPANVVGSPASDTLAKDKPEVSALGLGGGDLIVGAAGDDALCGGDGNDVLAGQGGADSMLGGPGTDTASYSNSGAPVAVTLDAFANDGPAGDGDKVVTESIVGGVAADLLIGDAVPNGILGGPGDDRIDGGAASDSVVGQAGNDVVNGSDGNDQVRGGDGNDQLLGGDGNDRLDGEEGADTLSGGGSADRLFGGPGPNTLLGGTGNDKIVGGSAKDVINCGAGRDLVLAAGKKDKVARNCEKVRRN